MPAIASLLNGLNFHLIPQLKLRLKHRLSGENMPPQDYHASSFYYYHNRYSNDAPRRPSIYYACNPQCSKPKQHPKTLSTTSARTMNQQHVQDRSPPFLWKGCVHLTSTKVFTITVTTNLYLHFPSHMHSHKLSKPKYTIEHVLFQWNLLDSHTFYFSTHSATHAEQCKSVCIQR